MSDKNKKVLRETDDLDQTMDIVNRIEIIGDGREFVKYLKEGERLRYVLQDDNCTLKIFIDGIKKV